MQQKNMTLEGFSGVFYCYKKTDLCLKSLSNWYIQILRILSTWYFVLQEYYFLSRYLEVVIIRLVQARRFLANFGRGFGFYISCSCT